MKRPTLLTLLLFAVSFLTCAAQNDSGLRVSVTTDTRITGRGDHATLMRIAIPKADSSKTIRMLSCKLNDSTNPSDIDYLMVFLSDSSNFPSSRMVGFSGQKSCEILFPLEVCPDLDTTYLWIVARVSQNALEGHEIVLTLTGITTAPHQEWT